MQFAFVDLLARAHVLTANGDKTVQMALPVWTFITEPEKDTAIASSKICTTGIQSSGKQSLSFNHRLNNIGTTHVFPQYEVLKPIVDREILEM